MPNSIKSRQGVIGLTSPQSADPIATFPLSHAQEGLWITEEITPGTPAHNLPEAWRLKGALDVRALRWSLEQIIQRQEALRTCFSQQDGKPVQMVVAPQPLPLSLTDLAQRADKQGLLEKWLRTEAQRPFDLARPPLMRARLFRLAQDEHVLFINMHHLISDAWSQRVFMHELAEFYSAAATGSQPELRELPIQYADFVLWQRERMSNGDLKGQLEYWQQKLKGSPSPVAIPTDHARPAQQSYRGATQFFVLQKRLLEDLRNVCRHEGCTLFMVLLAAFKTLLHRYTRQDDIIVGAPVAGRDRIETEDLIGFFVNTLALRTDLGGNPTFLELLTRVRETVLGSEAHQEVSSQKLMNIVQPQRDLSRHPLLPVVFGLQSRMQESRGLPGLQATRLELDNGAAKFDWTLLLAERGEVCDLRCEYSTDLFEPGTVLRLVHQYQVLLEGIASAPHKRLSELPLLTGAEREQLLLSWNRTSATFEDAECIHEIFERKAANHPDAVALACQGKTCTYAQLNQRSNQLARRLVAWGVGPDVLVGIWMDRSMEMVMSMLAILKAGGAYVPLDRYYPRERLEFMIQDTGLQVLVANGQVPRLDGLRPEGVIRLDHEAEALEKENPDNLPCRSGIEHLAYAMYTSGSTGAPKAVAIPHRGVVRLVRKPNYLEIAADDVFLQFAPASFDASTFEIWGALLNGAKLAMFPSHLASLEELGRTIQEQKVTILWLTAGLFHQMVDYQLNSLRGLRFLLAGGEALSVSHVKRFLSKSGSCQLINGYGPTENTTFSCCYRLPAAWPGGGSVPIGRPINQTEVYILDWSLQPVPIGVPGELYVGGDGLARGYLNRSELTKERFILHVLAGEPRKLYRTGDLARWLADGNIEFLGRVDEQIKIRGYRVEPAEVEIALAQHPGVNEALVIGRADKSGTNHLVAYVVPALNESLGADALRDFLTAKLPQFLVPSHFVILDSLPLSANGKVDHGALPSPELNEVLEPASTPPRNPREQALEGIWRDLLGCRTVGIHQNLFHLGCHSLLATQAISRIAKRFGVELPVRTIFESPTVAGLGEKVRLALEDRQKGGGLETSLKARVLGQSGLEFGSPTKEEVQQPQEFAPVLS